MKKATTFALLAVASAAASAQSSVTLFGVLDLNARYVKNGDVSLKSLSSGGINTSRLGFRGIEDLGGGLSAGFWLETGINPDTGTHLRRHPLLEPPQHGEPDQHAARRGAPRPRLHADLQRLLELRHLRQQRRGRGRQVLPDDARLGQPVHRHRHARRQPGELVHAEEPRRLLRPAVGRRRRRRVGQALLSAAAPAMPRVRWTCRPPTARPRSRRARRATTTSTS